MYTLTHSSPLLSLIPLPRIGFLFPISPSYFYICFALMIQGSPLQPLAVAWPERGTQQHSQHSMGYVIEENVSPSPSNLELHKNTQEMVGLISSFPSHKRTLAGTILCRWPQLQWLYYQKNSAFHPAPQFLSSYILFTLSSTMFPEPLRWWCGVPFTANIQPSLTVIMITSYL